MSNADSTEAEVLAALAAFHDASRAGDLERMLDAFTDLPQGATNGVPRTLADLRSHFAEHMRSFRARRADLRRARVVIDPEPESFFRYRDGQRVHARGCVLLAPVRYTKTGGVGVGRCTGTGASPAGDTIFVGYTMVLGDDGRWRIVHDRLLPDPDARAYDRDLLADAGRVLDQGTMAWCRTLDVSVKDAWRAISTKKGLSKWWLGRDPKLTIDLRVGGTFKHHWHSTIHRLEKGRFIDFDEFRIEVEPDGDATRLSFSVYTMNGDEWRAFWQVEEAPIFYRQFGGLDPWAAAGWHHVLDRLEEVLTGRPLKHGNESDPDFPWLPNDRLRHFYLVHLRELHHLRELSGKPPLKAVSADPAHFGSPRKETDYPPPAPKAAPEPARVEAITLEPQPALVVRGRTVMGNHLNAVAAGLPKVARYMKKRGLDACGRPFIRNLQVHTGRGGDTESIDYAVGYPIAGDDRGGGKVERHELPGGPALSTRFVGSYEQAPARWSLIAQAAGGAAAQEANRGRVLSGGWHVFVHDPREVGLERAESRLVLPVRDD